MPATLDPLFGQLINGRAHTALQTERWNSGGTAYEWATPLWLDQSGASIPGNLTLTFASANMLIGLESSYSNSWSLQVTSGGGVIGALHGGNQSLALDGANQRLGLASNAYICFSPNNNQWGNSADVSVFRTSAGYVAIGSGGASGAAWLQNSGADKRITQNYTNSAGSGSPTTISDLSISVGAGLNVFNTLRLVASDPSNVGFTVDMNGGTCTVTAVVYGIVSSPPKAVATTLSGGVSPAATITGAATYLITVEFTSNAAGTFIPRFWANGSGTITVSAGGWDNHDSFN